jgi:hypothetical protein
VTKKLIAAALLLVLGLPSLAWSQQTPRGIAPCAAHSLSVTNTSSNVQLANCGPSLILMNISSQEAFFNVGQASTTAATTSNYSIPGNAYLMVTVPDESANGWYVAGITSTSTTTIRMIEGRAQ